MDNIIYQFFLWDYDSNSCYRSFPSYIDGFRFTGGLALVSSYSGTTTEFSSS